jgi:hypothetical protein
MHRRGFYIIDVPSGSIAAKFPSLSQTGLPISIPPPLAPLNFASDSNAHSSFTHIR